MEHWAVSDRNYKRLEKLRPKGRQQNVVIQALLNLAKEKGLTKEDVDKVHL
jgi:hypothetical protein